MLKEVIGLLLNFGTIHNQFRWEPVVNPWLKTFDDVSESLRDNPLATAATKNKFRALRYISVQDYALGYILGPQSRLKAILLA